METMFMNLNLCILLVMDLLMMSTTSFSKDTCMTKWLDEISSLATFCEMTIKALDLSDWMVVEHLIIDKLTLAIQ
jgi:hypothetical protein